MTVVIADTSPINYLVLIGEAGILGQLYRRVVIPEAVLAELLDAGAPFKVSEWAARLPIWIEIRIASLNDTTLSDLDAGEAEVLLLIDETAGRREASRRGIRNTGTLGVLRRAAVENLIDLPSVLDRLQATNFRVSDSLVASLLAEDARRQVSGG